MPDLIRLAFLRCDATFETDVASSDGSQVYHVTIRGWDSSCTCAAHKYHPDRECKHIVAAREMGMGCGWNELFDTGGLVSVDHRCPRCGGPTAVFHDAV